MYPTTVAKYLKEETNRIVVIGVVSIVLGSSICIIASAKKVMNFIDNIKIEKLYIILELT